ncbi:hypothetical protein KL86DYS2_12135 [uncultured Dysgonomonas sp.]|uniref:Uncharacterized protein n=1 Tax=uncultured Dysgonomonas sp. TaxID=206096 RepID=A0A212JRB0_9BACT|nr:hypothetical protein KL86DYS2_12135 [uncultured Dysgonomonas sp.]
MKANHNMYPENLPLVMMYFNELRYNFESKSQLLILDILVKV